MLYIYNDSDQLDVFSMSDDSQRMVPWGVRKVLNWIKAHYGDIPVHVTVSAYEDQTSQNDDERVFYLREYINEVLKGKHITIKDTKSDNILPFEMTGLLCKIGSTSLTVGKRNVKNAVCYFQQIRNR